MCFFPGINSRVFCCQLRGEFDAMEREFCPLLRGPSADPEALALGLDGRLQAYIAEVKQAQNKIQEMITKAEGATRPGMNWEKVLILLFMMLYIY